MTPKQPPRIATWMLKHFGSGPDNDAVLGDLAEQYLHKDSGLWYWRQALTAIPVSFVREIRGNKGLAARALVTGWVLWIIGARLFFPVVSFGTDVGFPFVPSDPIDALAFAYGFTSLIVGAISGWLVSRWQICAETNPPALRILRVHRDQQTGVVLLFAGSVLLMNLLPLFSPELPYFAGLLVANAAASTLGIMLGGGLFRDRPSTVSN